MSDIIMFFGLGKIIKFPVSISLPVNFTFFIIVKNSVRHDGCSVLPLKEYLLKQKFY